MVKCSHESSLHRDWLPSGNSLTAPHPYCVKCGVVKNISSDRGKKIGYFVNIMYRLKNYLDKKGYRVSQAQIRLLIKEFEGIGDEFSIPFSTQKKFFIQIVKKYLRVSENTIESFF